MYTAPVALWPHTDRGLLKVERRAALSKAPVAPVPAAVDTLPSCRLTRRILFTGVSATYKKLAFSAEMPRG